MAKGLSNTQRTLRYLRQNGIIAGIVEKYNSFAGPFGVRQDLFGFIDIIALYPGEGIAGVQSCGQSFSSHDKKIKENEIAKEWIKEGGIIELIGWRKVKKVRGGKQMIWKPRIKRYTLDDFEG